MTRISSLILVLWINSVLAQDEVVTSVVIEQIQIEPRNDDGLDKSPAIPTATPLTPLNCVKEQNFDFTDMVLVNPQDLTSSTAEGCVKACLTHHPNKSHALVSFYSRQILSDIFKCLCATAKAIKATPVVAESKCFRTCPGSRSPCGDAEASMMSVYCLHHSCAHDQSEPICQHRRPHDSHGCVSGHFIDWSHAHNVRNFSADTNNHLACVWECHDHHARAMYSLTRQVDNVLTCSCGYPASLLPAQVVEKPFCKLYDSNYPSYELNCLRDLDEDGDTKVKDKDCKSIYPVGCIYSEFIKAASTIYVAPTKKPNPNLCHFACSSVFRKADHVGIAWTASNQTLSCKCLEPGSWNTSLVGPSSACDVQCQPEGTGLFCGGSGVKEFPAFSLYCLREGSEETIEDEDEDEETVLELNQTRPILRSIKTTLASSEVANDIILALLALICTLLLGIVTYLCFIRGISSLSKNIL